MLAVVFITTFWNNSYTKAFTPYHDLDDCYDVSLIDIEELNSLYPFDRESWDLDLWWEWHSIYIDNLENKFYSDLTLHNAPSNAQLEEIKNRCVYIYGNRSERNQTVNFQLGLEIASANNAYFYIEKNVYLDSAVFIKSNTTLIWVNDSENKASLSPYLNDINYLIIVNESASNVEFRNLSIREVREINQWFVLFQGNNESISMRSVDFIWKNIDPSKRTRWLFFIGEQQKDILIRDSSFSNIEYSIQFFSPIDWLQVLQNTFTKWSHYALLTNISTQVENGQSKNIEIRHNEFKHAAAGWDRWVILISPGKSVRYVTNVEITSNIIEGNWGSFINRARDPDILNNDAHGDQIVLHRVNDFIISNNTVSNGWENGITASRLSRNGIISNNQVFDNDGNGISVGSWYFELHLNNTDGLELWDRIKWTDTNSEATITYIYPNHNIVGIERINASSKVITSPTFGSEIITIDKWNTTLEKTITVVDRTKKIDLLDNEFFRNGHNSAKEHADWIFSWIYVINSDSINFRRNHFYNWAETLIQKWAITASRSRNLSRDGSNTYEDRELRRSDIQIQALTSINQ